MKMSIEELLHDVTIRERQLEAHILRSAGYLKRVNQDLKRQVWTLYVAIALLLFFQACATFHAIDHLPVFLIALISFLAIFNCVFLIRTKTWLRRLNEDWLGPQERSALEAIRLQRGEILSKLPRSRDDSANAELN